MIQKIEYPNNGKRIETGAVQFGNDWPGLFVRGDDAFGVAMDIDAILACLTEEQRTEQFFAVGGLREFVSLIRERVIVK